MYFLACRREPHPQSCIIASGDLFFSLTSVTEWVDGELFGSLVIHPWLLQIAVQDYLNIFGGYRLHPCHAYPPFVKKNLPLVLAIHTITNIISSPPPPTTKDLERGPTIDNIEFDYDETNITVKFTKNYGRNTVSNEDKTRQAK